MQHLSPTSPPSQPVARKTPSRSKPVADPRPAEESEADAPADDPLDREDLDEATVIETTGESVRARESVDDVASWRPPGQSSAQRALARLDPLQVYMNEVQQHALLSPQEEHELAVRYAETEDVASAARLVTANLRLVVKIAYEYRRAYRNMMDLIQEGNIGLMQAVKRYDPYRGVKLSSYSAWWIRAYMLRFILNNWRLVKIGTTQAQRKLFFNLSKEKAKLAAMGIEPSHAEIARRLNVDTKDVIEMDRRLARGDASLDSPISEGDGRTTTRMELLPAPSESPDELTAGAELQEMVRQRLDRFRTTLAGKDLVIFEQRMVADEPLTLQKLGEQFGVSRERVRQLEARLSGRLREYLKEELGDAVEVTN